MSRTIIRLSRKAFDWRKLLFSHGWVFLAPFVWTEDTETLTRPLRLSSGNNALVTLRAKQSGDRTAIRATVGAPALNAEDTATIHRQLTRSLRLADDFSEFHSLCKDDPVLWFVNEFRCGGLLRGVTAFEDVVKTTMSFQGGTPP